jgi:hypothetical protein
MISVIASVRYKRPPFRVWTTRVLANAGVVSESATMALRISNFAFISL